MNASDGLRKAAQILSESSWLQNRFYSEDAICMTTALARAFIPDANKYTSGRWLDDYVSKYPELGIAGKKLYAYLTLKLGYRPSEDVCGEKDFSHTNFCAYNNEQGRTKEEIIDALNKAADYELVSA
jgi:hypothetical protein